MKEKRKFPAEIGNRTRKKDRVTRLTQEVPPLHVSQDRLENPGINTLGTCEADPVQPRSNRTTNHIEIARVQFAEF